MSQGVNRYKADLREFQFVLFEQFKLQDVLGKGPFEMWGPDEANAVIKEGYRFATEVLGPINSAGDRQGCRIENGSVKTPEGFKAAWDRCRESGFGMLGISADHGGGGAPHAIQAVMEEMICGANTSFQMYPALARGAAEVIAAFGTPAQQKTYLEKMVSGEWGGTMCLTEPQAGSDVGAARSSAKKNADGTYSIRGTKIFISGGDHDLASNIVHLVLARIDGAAPGTKGLSLFIVPKVRLDGTPNDVSVGSIEHKLGINGSATCVLNFGENDRCVGELVGTTEHVGMSQMFKMMNSARIAVGLQGLGIAGTAYLNALEYARDRKQGSSIHQWKDPTAPRVAIIEHGDVRRMLLDMKSRVEGIRAMILKLCVHADRATELAGSDDEKAAYHKGQVELLTPLVKAYSSDQAFRVCETAIQVYGGAGYTKDYPVEQYLRDSKIFSIYEGTNHIQAMDLVGRKLGQSGGAHLMQFMSDVGEFVEKHKSHPELGTAVQTLAAAQEAVTGTAMTFMSWSQEGKLPQIPLVANRFLEMMSELTVGWLLLDAAIIAEEAAKKLDASHPDRKFYEGKKWSALYYARNVVATVPSKAQLIAAEDTSPSEIPAEAFATV
ncbi:MAG: acyl-CoA dehydrogenase [Myxococcales bacterium]